MGCRDYRGLAWHCHAAALNCTTAPHSEEVHFLTTTLDDPLARPFLMAVMVTVALQLVAAGADRQSRGWMEVPTLVRSHGAE